MSACCRTGEGSWSTEGYSRFASENILPFPTCKMEGGGFHVFICTHLIPKSMNFYCNFSLFFGGGGGWGKARVPQDYVPAANAGRIVLHNTFFQFCRLNSSTPSKCEGLTNMISGCPMKGVLV